ncbi:MAG: choice-of-anchor X domain-containing protein [bacterium]
MEKRNFGLFFINILLIFMILSEYANASIPPETFITAGPSGTISSNSIAFWWSARTMMPEGSDRLPTVKGFYYRMENEPWNWTQDRFAVYFNIASGEHTLYVKAVDSNNLEDPIPASRTFSILQSNLAEPDEGQVLFTISAGFKDDLNNKIVSTEIRQEFRNKGILLTNNALVIVRENEWLINDEKSYLLRLEGENIKIFGPINDSFSYAYSIEPGKSIKCLSQTGSGSVDNDWFKISLTDPKWNTIRQISVFFNRPDAKGSTLIRVYRSPNFGDGQEIARVNAKDKAFFATGAAPGDYYVHVKPSENEDSKAYYTLTVSVDNLTSSVFWDRENNDTVSNANETSPIFLSNLSPWMEIIGNRWGTNDTTDWFMIHLSNPQRQRLSINFTRPISGSTLLQLYSASPMNLLGEFTVTPSSSHQWKLEMGAALGDYLLRVDLSNYDSNNPELWKMPYFINLQLSNFPKGETWELEPNNIPDLADRMSLGVKIKATKGHANDTDWFKLNLLNNGILSLSASRILKNGSVNIYLLDLAGQLISEFKIASGKQESFLSNEISAGEYFIKIDFTDFDGDYWITPIFITSAEHDAPPDKILKFGDKLSVKLVWEKGNYAEFNIYTDQVLNKKPVIMYDDGLHDDENKDDGIYVGTYLISEGENAENAEIIVSIKDKSGNKANLIAKGEKIFIDTVSPVINQVSHDANMPLSVGKQLTMTMKGEPQNKAFFSIESENGEIWKDNIIAYDDGKHNDGAPNDGVYVGVYTISAEDYIDNAIVTGYLIDKAGNISNLSSNIKIDIFGERPIIYSVSHDGRLTLGEGDILTVELIGASGGFASFNIEGLKSNIPMYDDGKHNDGERGDGHYSGNYKIVKGDGVNSAVVTVNLIDREGRKSSKSAAIKVTIDAVEPSAVTGVRAFDRPNDQGNFIVVSWNASNELDFSHYNIYLSKEAPIKVSDNKPIGISPIITNITDSKITSIEINVDDNLKDYFFAVTATDAMGNESSLDKNGGSVAGPVQAEDNLKPSPVKVVKAVDRALDFGGVIILTWTEMNKGDDFARYNIYADTKPILKIDDLEPIDTITDRQMTVVDISLPSDDLYYFAVTAVDRSGNESDLDESGGSVSGPVKAENNIGEEPENALKFISAPVGIIHYNHVTFNWNRFYQQRAFRGYYIKLDDSSWQWTTETSIAYYNLKPGNHKFSIRLSDTSPTSPIIERTFVVEPISTLEQEPNNTREASNLIRTGIVINGDSKESEDWFRIHVPQSTVPSVMDVILLSENDFGTSKFFVYSVLPFQKIAESDKSRLTIGVIPGSDYFIQVPIGFSKYSLVATINKLPRGFLWEVENNDSADKSNIINLDDNLTNFEIIGNTESIDWFKVHISESSKKSLINIYLYSEIVKMQIFSSQRESDQIGEISNELRSFTSMIKSGSDYFIKVFNETSEHYQFFVSITEAPTGQDLAFEVEPNDFPLLANSLEIGTKKRGTSWDKDKDIDYYKISVQKDGILNVQFSRPKGRGVTTIELLNASFQLIGSFRADITNSQNNSINIKVKPGVYYVKIAPNDEDPSAEYTLLPIFIESINLSYTSTNGEKIIPQTRPIKIGDLINIEMKWNEVGGKAEFSIIDVLTGNPSRTIKMIDQGNGIYKGAYTISVGDNISNSLIVVTIEDKTNNIAKIVLDDLKLGFIDTIPPLISEISHDGVIPLSLGKRLTVRAIGSPNCVGKFDIVGFKTGIDMYNMIATDAEPPVVILNWDWSKDSNKFKVSGKVKNISETIQNFVKVEASFYDAENKLISTKSGYTSPYNIPSGVTSTFDIINDYTGKEKTIKLKLVYGSDSKIAGESSNEGVYIGIYDVGHNDNITNAPIIVHLIDSAGNQTSMEAKDKVTLDNIPPVIQSLSYNADKIFIEGDILTVTLEGEAGCEATFDIGDFQKGIKMSFADQKYVGTYRIRSGDKAIGVLIKGHLKDAAGNVSDYIGIQSISINTFAPSISSITYNTMGRPFIEGETLIITVDTEPGIIGTFDIEGLVSNRPLYDDGKHDDGDAGDGKYVGFYTVKNGDNAEDAKIRVTVNSPNGKTVQRYAIDTVSIDTTPPSPITGVQAVDRPNDNGGYIILSWNPSNDKDFYQYRIYQSDQYIISTRNLEPIEVINDKNITSVEVKTPLTLQGAVFVKYYFAVTAVDIATNESLLTRDSSAGPISSIDNIPPAPVEKVTAYDRAYDNGKVIVVTWTNSSTEEDFARYQIYMGRSQIGIIDRVPETYVLIDTSISDRNVRISNITVPEDDTDFYFVVTAVDLFGNESLITENSIAGPVQAKNNLVAVPETLVKIISGPWGEINHNDVTFRWLRWAGVPINGFYYKIDDDNWAWTDSTSKTYYDLKEGQHTFYVKADLGSDNVDPLPAMRIFSVKNVYISEQEPNNSGEHANWISYGMTIIGTNFDDTDEDWYKFHVSSLKPALMTLHMDKAKGSGNTYVTVFKSLPPIQESIIADFVIKPLELQNQGKIGFSAGVSFGDYFIRIYSQGENPNAKYEFSYVVDELPEGIIRWDTEYNDTPSSAQTIDRWNINKEIEKIPSAEISGFANREDDIDWYKLQILDVKPDLTAFMKLEFIRHRAIGTTEVSIYSSFPVNENSKTGFISYSPNLFTIQTIFVPVTSGDYFIKVDNSQENDKSSIYSFRITFVLTRDKWESEPNNLPQFANLLLLDEGIKGASWHPSDDTDWYKLRLEKRGTLVISFFRPYGKGSTKVTLKNADLSDIISAFADVMSGNKTTLSVNHDLGDYYVVIEPENETDPSAEYQLIATSLDISYSVFDAEIDQWTNALQTPLSVGDSIRLTIRSSLGNTISFDIDKIRLGLYLHDSANDGTYSGVYTVGKDDNLTDGKIKINLAMPTAKTTSSFIPWVASFYLQDENTSDLLSVNIDTRPPRIISVEHDMPLLPLNAGKSLKVKMTGEAKAREAYFEIQRQDFTTFMDNIPMEEKSDRVYEGEYIVSDGDNISDGIVICHLIDLAGNKSTRNALKPVTFDTTPPNIIEIKHNANKTLVEGDTLIITVKTDTKKGKAMFSIGDFIKDRIMYDDGTRGDEVADDGIYTGTYVIKKNDNVTDAIISVEVFDSAGNYSSAISYSPVTIDTMPPKIVSFVHNATKILSEGDELIVKLVGDPGNIAKFDIVDFKSDLPMYDDGTHGDEKADDGIYIGTYKVQKGDFAKSARITGYLINKNGNKSFNTIFERIDIDSIPPDPITGVKAIDKPNDQGFWISLSWDAPKDLEDFDHYNIYREPAPITSLLGLTPISTSGIINLELLSTNNVEVNVPANGINYYFAVTVVDKAGNESPINVVENGSVFGPVQAIDNIPPEPVTVVSAYDRPSDQGRVAVISWTSLSRELDFDKYGIYISQKPIISLDDMEPVMKVTAKEIVMVNKDQVTDIQYPGVYVTVPKDGVEYYFAVTAYDKTGNESSLDKLGRSVAGPVITKDDLPPDPVFVVDAVDTPSDKGGYINVIWLLGSSNDVQYYNIYSSTQFIDNNLIKRLDPIYSVDKADLLLQNSEKGDSLAIQKVKVQEGLLYIAVTSVDYGNNESKLFENGDSAAGPVQAISNTIRADSETRISAGFDPDTYVIVPVGAMREGETIDITFPDDQTIQKILEANKFLEISHIDPKIDNIFNNTIRHIKFSSGSSTYSTRRPITLVLSYPDADDIKSDNFKISQNDERQFRIFKLNEVSRIPRWDLVPGSHKVNTQQNTISIQTDSFGVYRVARLKLPENLDRVVVYPNPFIPSQSLNGYITFKNLTENVTIDIYTINGEHVRTIEKFGGGDELIWDVLNKDGEQVASGTYVYVIQNNLQSFVGKVVILR